VNVTTTPDSGLPVLLVTVAVAVAGAANDTAADDRASVTTGAVAGVVVPPPPEVEPLDFSGAPPALQPATAATTTRFAATIKNFLIFATSRAVPANAPNVAVVFIPP
jgi:hypothetical protein